MSKKLIYVLNSYSSNESSHFAHLAHLLHEMVRQGCEITLVIEKMQAKPENMGSTIRVIGLRHRKSLLRHIELFFLLLSLINQGYNRSFYRINASACIVGALAHRMMGGKTFLWQSGTTHEVDWGQPFGWKKFKWWLGSYVPNWVARKITTHFVTGPQKMVDYYHDVVGISREKIRLLYNDIQIERFAELDREQMRTDYLRSCGLPSNTTVLLIVHRLSPVRRTIEYLRPLLRMLADCDVNQPWRLIVAGGGSEFGQAVELAHQTGTASRVEFLGEVPNRDLPSIYAKADIFLQPSYTEGFPRVLLEAMATSIPIVTTDAGGTEQLVGIRQTAYVIAKDSPEAFAKATIKLMDHREEWPVIGQENRVHVERFSTPVVASMYLETLFS
jgi:glycosyltransferase involved in cell wall biosynthesis